MSSPHPQVPASEVIDLDDPALYVNRELGQVAFIQRVLALAEDEAIPLLERLRYLTICSTLVDEFFEIRVSGVKHQHTLGLPAPGPDGLTPLQTLEALADELQALVATQYRSLNEILLPALQDEGVHLLRRSELTDAQAAWVDGYFKEQVLPVLTPISLDPAHPFPNLLNKSLNFLVGLEGVDAFGRTSKVAVVQVPRCLPGSSPSRRTSAASPTSSSRSPRSSTGTSAGSSAG